MNIIGKLINAGRHLDQFLPTDKAKQHTQPVPVKPAMPHSDDNVEQHSATAIGSRVLFRSLSTQFSSSVQFAEKFNQSIAEIEEKNKSLFDFKKVAETVLGFIGKALHGAKKDGADHDKMQSLIEHARKGVDTGINDAKKELDGMKMLNDEVLDGIKKSHDLIFKGIDELAKELIPTDANSNKVTNNPVKSSNQYGSSVYASSSVSSNLTIQTADGDKVAISFSAFNESLTSESFSSSQSDQGKTTQYGFSHQQYSDMRFSYSIEGDLDDEEREAIAVLVKDINSLQQDFFAGDVEAAYEKALELGINSKELTSVSLNLAKVESTVVAQAYRDIASMTQAKKDDKEQATKPNQVSQSLKPLADFSERYQQLQEVADKILASNRAYFKELMEQVIKADTPNDNNLLNDKLNRFNQIDKYIAPAITE